MSGDRLRRSAGAVSGGYTPDLRASEAFLDLDDLKAIVQDGALQSNGMPNFKNLSDEDLEALRHFVRKKAQEAEPPSH